MDRQSFIFLYQKYLSGSCTPEETETFHKYLLLPEAETLLRELLHGTYSDIRNYSATLVDSGGKLVPAPTTHVLPTLLPGQRRLRRIRTVAVAAAVALVAGLGLWVGWENRYASAGAPPRPTRSTVTARSEFKKLLLPDSSVVWLNAGSRLDFPERFGSGNREVTLSGEASFDIRHAADHPFIIHTGRIETRVLGTAFNINAYPGQKSVTVSVSRGKVQVLRDNQTLATLLKGQEVRVENGSDVRPIRKAIAVASVAAWQRGYLDYDDQSLAEVASDLGRTFNADIRIDNIRLRDLRISTRLRKEEGLDQALEILGKLTESHISFQHNVYSIQ